MRNKKEFNERANKKEESLKKGIDESGGLEKKDMFAMIGSAFLTIFPICALIVIALGLFMLWLFQAL